MILSLEFQEAYKRLDKLCKECFSSNDGVSEYIRTMESEKWLGEKYVSSWEDDYKALKHVRWIRNQFSHEVGTLQSGICSQFDLEFVENFYESIIICTDPLTMLRKEKERVKNQKSQNERIQRTNKSNDVSFQGKEVRKSFFGRIVEKIKSLFS